MSSTVCPHLFSVVSHLLSFYIVSLPIIKIFIHLIVVFILFYVITWLTSSLLVAFIVFFWVIIHLIKGFRWLNPKPPDSVSPILHNFMKTTLPSSIFTSLIHILSPNLTISGTKFRSHSFNILLNLDPLFVLFVLIQWMSLCRQLKHVYLCHTWISDLFFLSLSLSHLSLITFLLQLFHWVLILRSHEPRLAYSKRDIWHISTLWVPLAFFLLFLNLLNLKDSNLLLRIPPGSLP